MDFLSHLWKHPAWAALNGILHCVQNDHGCHFDRGWRWEIQNSVMLNWFQHPNKEVILHPDNHRAVQNDRWVLWSFRHEEGNDDWEILNPRKIDFSHSLYSVRNDKWGYYFLKPFFVYLFALFIVVSPGTHLLIITETAGDFFGAIRIVLGIAPMFEAILEVHFKFGGSVCI